MSWRRAARLDAERMVDGLARVAGVRLVVEGPCAGGEVGAALVRWPDGRRSVLKWRPGGRLADVVGPFLVPDLLRADGYPAPATELAVQVGDDVVHVQELLPGRKIDLLDHAGLDQALELNRRQRGRLAGRRDVPLTPLYLRVDGPGFCLHGPLREFSARSAALAQWVVAVADECPDDVLPGDDAMHLDFHPGNMLMADGVITGIVDWDGAGRGDCRLDLVTLRFGLHPDHADVGVAERLDSVLDSIPVDVLRPAWAHMSLRMVDWAIRHFSRADVDRWLAFAERLR